MWNSLGSRIRTRHCRGAKNGGANLDCPSHGATDSEMDQCKDKQECRVCELSHHKIYFHICKKQFEFAVKAHGDFGSWGSTESCPPGSFVTRFRTRSHQSGTIDKKGLTGQIKKD